MTKYLNISGRRISVNKIEDFQTGILRWYKENGRDFPWRKKRLTNYQYIIAETLLQRTKAETVSKFFNSFINMYPNWTALSNAKIKILEKYLKPLGLYRQRAARLISLAKEMKKRNGRLPKDRIELESIPFLGQYIANSIELLIFKQSSPLLDVNMARVNERYFGLRALSDIRHDPYLQKLSYAVVNHYNSRELNWAILDFASKNCKILPLCINCFLNKSCKYYNQSL
jgi:A/G-specific adenine glycosylase